MRTTSGVFIVCMTAFVLTPSAHSQTSVTFGGTLDYPPFHYYDQNGVATGFDVAIFDRISALAGWTANYELGDWSAIQNALAEGSVDIVPMFISDERSENYLFSNAINIEHHLLFGPMDADSHDDLTTLSDQRIASENSSFAASELQKINPNIIILAAPSERAALQMVANGESDYALLPSRIGQDIVVSEQIDNIAILSPPILPATYAFAINPNRPELAIQANAAIAQMQRTGELSNLRDQWLLPGQAQASTAALQLALWTVVALLALSGMMVAGFWHYRARFNEAKIGLLSRDNLIRESAKKISSMYTKDVLTGLPNRSRFTRLLARKLSKASSPNIMMAVGIITLHNLDTIQDVLDDDAGDELIKAFAALATNTTGLQPAYFGQGLFGFLFESVRDKNDAFHQMKNLIAMLSKDFNIRGMVVHTQLSSGMAIYPDDARSAADLIKKAKLAISNARQSGAQLLFFTEAMKPNPQKLQMIADLKETIASRELAWALQPQYNVSAGKVNAAEMLVRWQHSEYGWVPPCDFVVWAEQSGFVTDITEAAIMNVSKLLDQFRALDRTHRISVNLSANDLASDAMVDMIIEHTVEHSITLTLEITETALMRDMKSVIRNVERLKQTGIHISLDDYGTGYSSLEYLQAFQFDEIKIDRMFVKEISRIERNRKLTQTSIELGHHLGAIVVAEGVEDKESANMLIDMGCDVLQGYFISRPVIVDELRDYLSTADAIRV